MIGLKQDETGQHYMEKHEVITGVNTCTRINVPAPKNVKLCNPDNDLMRAYLTSDGMRVPLDA